MKLRVIGVDISDAQLENAKLLGADLTFNSASQPDYVTDLFHETGGAHATVVLSASNAAYASAPNVLRSGSSLMYCPLHLFTNITESMDSSWLWASQMPTYQLTLSIFFSGNTALWGPAVAPPSK